MSHFTDEEPEVQRGEAACLGSYLVEEEELGSDPGRLVLAGASPTLVLQRAWL